MSAPTERVAARHQLQRTEGRSMAWWGVILLSTTEGVLFAVLLVTYAYLWSVAPQWPPEGVEAPELLTSSIRSVLLLSSSVTAWMAERALAGGRRRAASAWLVATIGLAGIFLAGHVEEMLRLPEEFTWRDHAYGSIYYTVTNFHAAHLAVGVIIFAFLLARIAPGIHREGEELQLSIGTLYWHFVDGVWVMVFTTLYLLPALFGSGS